MENYIVINGKKAELTPEQLKALGIEVEKKNQFHRSKRYYFIYNDGSIAAALEIDKNRDDDRYNIANYCTDRDLLQQQAYRETLNRLLWRFSMENNRGNKKWDLDNLRYHIIYNHRGNEWIIDWSSFYQRIGVVYFDSEEIAQRAIEEIVKPFMEAHPDFKL